MVQRSAHPRAAGGSAGGRNTLSRRVHDMLLASVRFGIYAEDQVLVEDQLIACCDASRSAVREALRKLAEDGVVQRHPRSGTIVVNTGVQIALEDIALLGATNEEIEILITEQRMVPSTALLRTRLSAADQQLRMIENLFLLKGDVIGLRTAYFRSSFNTVTYSGRADMAEVVASFFGRTVSRIETSVSASMCDARTARIFQVQEGAPVLVRNQTFFDLQDRPIQIVFDHYRADRVAFIQRNSSAQGTATSPHVHVPDRREEDDGIGSPDTDMAATA
ncbi:MAG: GntR family transcriptional regulator [Rhodococcus sp. (in: high G+C Gram-positive bacteria)]|uniref:GntR family transcriptional regulator n=1 Tax=Rhodococcus sp. TaxID=1831 RepID=UPI003BAE6D21